MFRFIAKRSQLLLTTSTIFRGVQGVSSFGYVDDKITEDKIHLNKIYNYPNLRKPLLQSLVKCDGAGLEKVDAFDRLCFHGKTGIQQEWIDKLANIFDFYYMGRSEYETGSVTKALNAIQQGIKKHVYELCETDVFVEPIASESACTYNSDGKYTTRTIYIICPKGEAFEWAFYAQQLILYNSNRIPLEAKAAVQLWGTGMGFHSEEDGKEWESLFAKYDHVISDIQKFNGAEGDEYKKELDLLREQQEKKRQKRGQDAWTESHYRGAEKVPVGWLHLNDNVMIFADKETAYKTLKMFLSN